LALSYFFTASSILRRGLLTGTGHVAQTHDTRLLSSTFRAPYFIQLTVFLVAYCIAGKIGQATTNIRSSNLGPVWPAYGIALAAFLVCGYAVWPAIALGAFLVAFFSPVSHFAALGQAAGATLAAFTGALLLQRVAEFDKSLSRLRDAVALVLLGALGSALVSASIGISVLYATHIHAYSGLGSAWLIYWLGDATGALLVTPIALTLPRFVRIRDRTRITELVVLFLLLIGACFLIFGDPSVIPVRLHVLAFAVLPFVMWAAIRFGVTGAAFSVLLIATIATVETALGSGPFAISTPFTNAVLLDAFFAVLSVTGLTLASAIGEREQAQREREQSVREQGALEARLAAAQMVHASDERLRLAQQAARIGTFERDIQTEVVTWTVELEAMYGLQPGQFNKTTTAFFENLVHPDDRERVRQLTNEAIKTGKPMTAEWRVLWRDGSVHWIAGRWQVLMDHSGEPSRMIGVNMDVTERKLADEKLQEYERAVEGSEEMISVLDREYRYLIANRQFLKIQNLTREQVLGHFAHELLTPGVFEAVVKRKLDECFQGNVVRYEMRYTYPELGERDLFISYFPIEGANGIDRVACILQDVTERKQAEEVLADMSRKLIEAQEEERKRIARELHDDINQRLAMLAVELQRLQEGSDAPFRIQELRKDIAGISNDLQALSHDLHSSKLEYLGVVAGIESWCKEVAARQKIEVDFRSEVHGTLPLEIGHSLFRVLQEALHNALKHSRVTRVEVQLAEYSNEVHLTVSDSGSGFDVEAAREGTGLGLTSMQERVRLLNGSIIIKSKPMGGTTIHVSVPLDSQQGFQRAVG
jgi:PAS domain S-box-containing protein